MSLVRIVLMRTYTENKLPNIKSSNMFHRQMFLVSQYCYFCAIEFLFMCCLSECVCLIFLLPLDEKKDISISDMKLEDKSSKATAVIEAMTMTVHEKTKLEKSTDDSSYKERIVQEPVITARIQELSVDGQSEHGEAKNTSQDSVQVFFVCIFTIVQKKCPRNAVKGSVNEFTVGSFSV